MIQDIMMLVGVIVAGAVVAAVVIMGFIKFWELNEND